MTKEEMLRAIHQSGFQLRPSESVEENYVRFTELDARLAERSLEMLPSGPPWELLKNQIRSMPEPVIIRVFYGYETSLNDTTTLVMEMGGKVICQQGFNTDELLDKGEGYLKGFMKEVFENEIDKRLEGVDWSTYFDGIDRVAEGSDTETL